MRLIDADKFVLALMDASLSSVDEDTILDLVDGIKTVDAVPVTRCMDCESARGLTQHESLYLADGVLICTNCEVSENCRLPVWPQHFCGYGREKDGSEDDAVEIVPIVRCENCLYWVSGENECESWEWCKMLNRDMPPHAFCNLGVRKDEERNER